MVARWPHIILRGVPDEAHFAKSAWLLNIEDVERADVVMVYGERDDRLRGALVEAGVALANGKHVIVVGDHEDYGTWQHHSLVHRAPDLDAARAIIGVLATDRLA